MEFISRSSGRPHKVGILAGSFNPPTVAHLELAYAAGVHVDEILFVIPRVFPHKEYFGATLDQRLAMLQTLELAGAHSIAVSDRGLFIDIARECQAEYGTGTELYFLCGTDAADRIMTWDYGHPGFAIEMLKEFQLLVARRGSDYVAPVPFRNRIHPLHMRGDYHAVSSTEVRERILRKDAWEHLVPREIIEAARTIYS